MNTMHRARITAVALLTAFCVGGTGCMSVFFHNDGTEDKKTSTDRFHHIAVANLWEVSRPMDLGDRCPNGWRTVKTERGPTAILISFFTQPFYGPMTIGVECK